MTCPTGGRDATLRAMLDAARDAGDALSQIDRLGTGWDRIAAADARLRELLEALPPAEREAFAPHVARGATSAWSSIEGLARFLLGP
jgi:hypothetical protein